MAIAVALAIALSLAAGLTSMASRAWAADAEATSQARPADDPYASVTAKPAAAKKAATTKGAWKVHNGYVYYKENGKRATGLVTINGKTYLFDDQGRQKVGWQRYKGKYRYFKIANKAGGYMVKNKVVNGIRLRKDGTAGYSKAGGEELALMVSAQKLVEKLTKPTQSRKKKLSAGFDWMRYDCTEHALHDFSNYNGWHRSFAREILERHMGSCFSYGAAFAYYANAVGMKSCRIVSSGGHGWAEVSGAVYDVEWTRTTGYRYFNFPYSRSGGNAPLYSSNRTYVVQISPKTSTW